VGEDWIDISVTLSSGMVRWPSDPPAAIRRVQDLEAGAPANLTHMDMCAHTGTHVDAPLHFVRGGQGIDEMPLDVGIGPCRVVEVLDRDSVGADDLRPFDPRPGERLLIKTRNSRGRWEREPFDPRFVHLRGSAAEFLAGRGIRTLGIDYLSVGGYEVDGVETHLALLQAGVWIIEGLNLGAVSPGEYELVCLPLRLFGADGAPARAVLRARGRIRP
jgi:arylformamidase